MTLAAGSFGRRHPKTQIAGLRIRHGSRVGVVDNLEAREQTIADEEQDVKISALRSNRYRLSTSSVCGLTLNREIDRAASALANADNLDGIRLSPQIVASGKFGR